jgi:hypothetical protein
LKELAATEKLNLADLNTPTIAMLAKANAADSATAAKVIPDRVHPGPGGHLIIAEALLKSWNAPEIACAAEIDAPRREAVRQVSTRISELRGGKDLSWTQLDDALPMALDTKDATLALAVRSSDFITALDQQPLKVSGLAAGKYTLCINGESSGALSA